MSPAEDEFDLGEGAQAAPSADEVLVAYLDGQLDAEESERIEARLASDAAVREKLQALDRVWNALDALPRSTASATFTRSTVDMAAVSASRASHGKSRRWRPPVWLLASAVGLVAGALLTLAVATAPERNALNNLPTVLNASALENVGSIEYLKSLHERIESQREGQALRAFRTAEVQNRADEWDRLTAAPTPERRDWIAALPPDELTAVNSAVDRFRDRSSAKREELMALARQVDEDPQAPALRATALAYQEMVSRLPQSEQARIRQMDETARLEHVGSRSQRWSRDAALELDAAQREAFRNAIDSLVESEEFAEQLRSLKRRFPQTPDRPNIRPHQTLLFTTQMVADPMHLFRRRGRPGGERFEKTLRTRYEEAVRERLQPLEEAWGPWADTLAGALPDAAQRVLEEARSRDDREHARLMHRLLRDALAQDLSDAFVELPEEQMERALLEPRDTFTQMLSDQSTGGFEFGMGRPGRGGPPRRFDGPPPRPDGERPLGWSGERPPRPSGGRPPFGPGGGPPPRRGD